MKAKKGLAISTILLFISISVIPSTSANFEKTSLSFDGKTLYVGGSGEGNYTKIQDAIDDAGLFDTVYVYDDSSPYYENIEIRKELTIIGENKETTIIDGSGRDTVVHLDGVGAKITGFTIQNGGGRKYYDAGILIDGPDNIVTGNIIKNNKKNGVYILSSRNIISNNIIKNNNYFGVSIGYYSGSNNIIVDNIFEQHDSIYIDWFSNYDTHIIKNNIANGKPIRCYKNENDVIAPVETSQVILINCNNFTIQNVDSSGLDIGVLIIGDSSNNHIRDCTIMDNTWVGVLIVSYKGINNNISNNIIANNYYGVLIVDSEYNTLYGNTVDSNYFGIYIEPFAIPGSTSTKHDYQLGGTGDYNNIFNNNITNNEYGIFLSHSSHNNISQNYMKQNELGIWIFANYDYGGVNNTVCQNNFLNNRNGISISGAVGGPNDNNIYQNDIRSNRNGIGIGGGVGGGAHNNNIYRNNITNNWKGLNIWGLLEGAYDNNVYQNNFIGNIRNAKDSSNSQYDANYWDNWIGLKIELPIFQRFPKIIFGFFKLNFDWNPALEPYDIPGSSSFVGCGIK